MLPNKIAEIVQAEKYPTEKNEKAFAQCVRAIEEDCKIDANFSLLDFNIKSQSRRTIDQDRAYFGARQDTTVWANIKEGNTLLLEYEPEEDGAMTDATTLRMGLPKFFALNYDAISETKRKLLPREAEAAFFHNETLAQVRKAILSGAKIEVQ